MALVAAAMLRIRHGKQLATVAARACLATKARTSLAAASHALRREMEGWLCDEVDGVPERADAYWYYTRARPGSDFLLHCRRRGSMQGPEEVVLDPAQLGDAGSSFVGLNSISMSHDHQYVAYTIDTTGQERFRAEVRHVPSGRLLASDTIPRARALEWGATTEPRAFLYTVPDALHRPYRVYRHVVGQPVAADELLVEETDPTFFLDVKRSKDQRFLVISSNSKSTSEAHVLDARRVDSRPVLVRRRQAGVEYYVEHAQDRLFIVTNADGAADYKLVTLPSARVAAQDGQALDAGLGAWETVYEPAAGTRIEDLDVLHSHAAVYERREGAPQVRVFPLRQPSQQRMVPLPATAGSVKPGANQVRGRLLRTCGRRGVADATGSTTAAAHCASWLPPPWCRRS